MVKQNKLNDEVELIGRALLEFMEHHQTARVVARYEMDGEIYEITQADVEEVRVRMVKPRSERTLQTLALASKMAEQRKYLPRHEKFRELRQTVEASRLESIKF